MVCVKKVAVQCTPCREGLFHIRNILDKIREGRGELKDLDSISEISEAMRDMSLCGLGKTSSNPFLSAVRYSKDEILSHITQKSCPAGVCKALITYSINDKCTGCTLCARNCPVSCIAGERKAKHVIDQSKCIKCGICLTSVQI
jgi:NADH-quinone oxidoreductase subunit F/NADP-reducing hydrogenase subunit HndC